jgi:hypothetical protein
MPRATVLPRYEIALSPGEAAEVLENLSKAGDRAAEAAAREGRDLERMTSELFFEGMERVAGHYGQDLVAPWTYLPDDAGVWLDDPERLARRGLTLDDEIKRQYDNAVAHFPLISPPSELFCTWEETLASVASGPPCTRSDGRAQVGSARVLSAPTAPQPAFTRNLELVRSFLNDLNAKGSEIHVLCDNLGQMNRLEELLGATPARLEVGLVAHGFTTAGFALLTDHEIFERYRRRVRRRKKIAGLSSPSSTRSIPATTSSTSSTGSASTRG